MEAKRGGWSLVELLVVLVIAGIAAAIVAPRMEGMLAVMRVRGAANRLAADLAYTRHLAVRTGRRARLVLERSADCPTPPRAVVAGHRYRIVVASPDSVAVRVDLRVDGGRLCLSSNQSAEVVFNSRGLLAGFNNRTLTLRQGAAPPRTITLSAVGRILRN